MAGISTPLQISSRRARPSDGIPSNRKGRGFAAPGAYAGGAGTPVGPGGAPMPYLGGPPPGYGGGPPGYGGPPMMPAMAARAAAPVDGFIFSRARRGSVVNPARS